VQRQHSANVVQTWYKCSVNVVLSSVAVGSFFLCVVTFHSSANSYVISVEVEKNTFLDRKSFLGHMYRSLDSYRNC
jgi:hypothetical protein